VEVKDFASSEAHEYNMVQGEAILKSRFAGCSSNEVSSDAVEREGKMKQTQRGKVLAVNISKDKGTKKTNIQSCLVVRESGLKGDAHAGPWHRQVSLLANESIEKMRAMGLKVGYGDFAENITTEGIDLVHLPIGTEIRIGDSILLRVTQIGKECHERCAIYYQAGDCVMPKEGIFAEVINEGEVKVGDEIIIDQ
jgi:MOSC domain-containing protein YiiM